MVDIGFEVTKNIKDGDLIEGDANERNLNLARAIGVENAEFGNDPNGYIIRLGNGKDSIKGRAVAEAEKEAFADGIRNTGEINLGRAPDLLEGIGKATTTGNGKTTIATGINSAGDSVITLGKGKDIVKGIATAMGKDNVSAFGILLTEVDAGTNQSPDTIKGKAIAEGVTTTDARGISNGFSGIDDDTIANPENAAGGAAGVGLLLTGKGDDILEGKAKVTVDAQDGDEIFFAGANGIVNDGPTLEDLEASLAEIGKDLTNFDGEDVKEIIGQLDTSTLNTGRGNDTLSAQVKLNASQVGEGADSDLEVIGDGIENAGQVFLGQGNDSVNSTVEVRTSIPGAKGLADALDNSSVGIITGLKLETNNETLFDMGLGDDTFTSNIFATAVSDLAAADGLGNRGVFVAGGGDDTLNLTALSKLVLENENDNEQQEAIADGWENRSRVFLDDQQGKVSGNDSVTTSANTTGKGVLTIAEGIESREFFDAGGGNDTFDLSAVAVTGIGAVSDNLTQSAGLQTEQIDEGLFLLQSGNDSITGQAKATSEAVAGEFTPSTFAFGITQMTADANNTDQEDKTNVLDTGDGQDLLEGFAEASGQTDVASFGLLIENTVTQIGDDTLLGDATANSADVALAAGIAVGLAEGIYEKQNSVDSRDNGDGIDYGLGAEAGVLITGRDHDIIKATANAVAHNEAVARGLDSANGVVNLGKGDDEILAQATAHSGNGESEAFGIFGGEINAGHGSDTIKAHSNDDLVGISGFSLVGGQSFGGDVEINLEEGDDTLLGFGEASADGGNGHDILQFEFSLKEFVEGGGTVNESADFSFADITFKTAGFEQFQFGVDWESGLSHGETFHSFSELQQVLL